MVLQWKGEGRGATKKDVGAKDSCCLEHEINVDSIKGKLDLAGVVLLEKGNASSFLHGT